MVPLSRYSEHFTKYCDDCITGIIFVNTGKLKILETNLKSEESAYFDLIFL